jgi:signal transduction histidine kinase
MTPAEIGPSAAGESQFGEPATGGAFDNSLFRQILETVPFGLFVLDAGGRSVYANSRAISILRKDASKDIGIADLASTYSAYVAGTGEPYPAGRMPIVRALAGESSSVSDMEIRHDDGALVLEVSGAPILDASGRVKFAVAVFHDVTATRTLESTLRRLAGELEARVRERSDQLDALQRSAASSLGLDPGSSPDEPHDDGPIEPCGRCIVYHEVEQLRASAGLANQALNLFIANFSHELRTPLNHIIGFSDLIESKIQSGVTQGIDKHAETIRRSGASLLDTLDRIITVAEAESRNRPLNLELFDIEQLLRDAIARFEPCARRNGNRLELTVQGEIGPARSDSARIGTALAQILENACKHCTDGIVSLGVSRDGDGINATIAITVSDTGPGIDPARAARLARGEVAPGDPHGDGGLGIGIPLAARSLRAVGGALGFTTVAGGGTRFVLSFPANGRG